MVCSGTVKTVEGSLASLLAQLVGVFFITLIGKGQDHSPCWGNPLMGWGPRQIMTK